MQIIAKFESDCNTLSTIIFYGPNEIPADHELHGRKLNRHGTYKRGLILASGITVTFIIFRFCETTETGYKTYSLLPSFISPYQWYINEIIDCVLNQFHIKKKSKANISNELLIEPETIDRWIKKFTEKVNDYDEVTEKMLIVREPNYRAVANSLGNMQAVVDNLFKKINHLMSLGFTPLSEGITSWLNFNIKPFLGRIENIYSYA